MFSNKCISPYFLHIILLSFCFRIGYGVDDISLKLIRTGNEGTTTNNGKISMSFVGQNMPDLKKSLIKIIDMGSPDSVSKFPFSETFFIQLPDYTTGTLLYNINVEEYATNPLQYFFEVVPTSIQMASMQSYFVDKMNSFNAIILRRQDE